ncbi:MAG: hypothetical protein K8F58_04585 [Bauldia sp.]|nr:hypothetical protein [Bauldia sp.]
MDSLRLGVAVAFLKSFETPAMFVNFLPVPVQRIVKAGHQVFDGAHARINAAGRFL